GVTCFSTGARLGRGRPSPSATGSAACDTGTTVPIIAIKVRERKKSAKCMSNSKTSRLRKPTRAALEHGLQNFLHGVDIFLGRVADYSSHTAYRRSDRGCRSC